MRVRRKLGEFPSLRTVRKFFASNARRKFRTQCEDGCALVEATGYRVFTQGYNLLTEKSWAPQTELPEWAKEFIRRADVGPTITGAKARNLLDDIEREAA